MKKYVAEFKKEYNHHTKESKWVSWDVFEKVSDHALSPIHADDEWYESIIDPSHFVCLGTMHDVMKINPGIYSYRVICEEAINNGSIDRDMLNNNFENFDVV